MRSSIKRFEKIARSIGGDFRPRLSEQSSTHPFDERNIHPEITSVSVKLFNDGHYSQATFEAFKFLDNKIKNISGVNETGHKLMMAAFSETSPKIKLTSLITSSDIDEQFGFRFMFAGSMSAIRNPRGHVILSDTIDTCLDHLSVGSVLLRKLDNRTAP